MVRYKSMPNQRRYGVPTSDTYWRLGFDTNRTIKQLKDFLDARDYQYALSASKTELVKAVGRCQRGLLSYRKCSTDELRAFCHVRALSIPARSTKVARLSSVLEAADEEATFTRFLDLPVELRVKVYELHFRDFDRITRRHRQPPITLVPQIRTEALPLFYGCVTFSWGLVPRHPVANYRATIREYHFDYHSNGLLRMPNANLAQIKNFQLLWSRTQRVDEFTESPWPEFDVRVSQSNNAKRELTLVRKNKRIETQRIEQAIYRVLREMSFGESTWKLDWLKFDAIPSKVNRILREQS